MFVLTLDVLVLGFKLKCLNTIVMCLPLSLSLRLLVYLQYCYPIKTKCHKSLYNIAIMSIF